MMHQEEIESVYRSGCASVVQLVQSQEHQIEHLSSRVAELEARLGKDSHNSSKPPSSDGLGKTPRTRSLRQSSGKRPGAQQGHAGRTLKWCEKPDEVIEHSPRSCLCCGAGLEQVEASGSECRQEHEIPPLRLRVIEHRALSKICPHCGQLNSEPFASHLSEPVQYGSRLKALAVYLLDYQLLPYERTRELLSDLFTAAAADAAVPSVGTLATAVTTCHERLAPVEMAIKQALSRCEVVHFDETGIRVKKDLQWVHQSGTSHLTHYQCHPKRRTAATGEIRILPAFEGTAVHDGWCAYPVYDCSHALCNAHLLRELTFIEEQTKQSWCGSFKKLLCEIKQATDTAREQGQEQLEPRCRHQFAQRYRQLIEQGLQADAGTAVNAAKHTQLAADAKTVAGKRRGRVKQSAAKNLLDRLQQREAWVLAFMHDLNVPFDNNLAERDLRMVKVQQKISGTFRSQAGAEAFCRIRGYISTLRKQSAHVMTALESVFRDQPYMPKLHPE